MFVAPYSFALFEFTRIPRIVSNKAQAAMEALPSDQTNHPEQSLGDANAESEEGHVTRKSVQGTDESKQKEIDQNTERSGCKAAHSPKENQPANKLPSPYPVQYFRRFTSSQKHDRIGRRHSTTSKKIDSTPLSRQFVQRRSLRSGSMTERRSSSTKFSSAALSVMTLHELLTRRKSFQKKKSKSSFTDGVQGSEVHQEENLSGKHEELIERFQLRRLQHIPSTNAEKNSTTYSIRSSKSSKVCPGLTMEVGSAFPAKNGESPKSSSTSPRDFTLKRASKYSVESARLEIDDALEGGATFETVNSKNQGRDHEKLANLTMQQNFYIAHPVVPVTQDGFKQRMKSVYNHLSSPIHPFSRFANLWRICVMPVFVVHALLNPSEAAFISKHHVSSNSAESIIDILFIIEVLLHFNTAIIDSQGALIESRKEIAQKYVFGWFVFDAFGALPEALIVAVTTESYTGFSKKFRLASHMLFCVHRFIHHVNLLTQLIATYRHRPGRPVIAWLLYSRFSHLVRILIVITMVLFISHYIACFWRLLLEDKDLLSTPQEQYAASFYDALKMLQGEGILTSTSQQNYFASFTMLLGSILLAIVFGHVGVLVANFTANSTSYRRKMEEVYAIMGKMGLPLLLRERVQQFYEHIHQEYQSIDGDISKFTKELTHNLALEVFLFKYMDIVVHIPFWQDCSADFQKQIILNLQVRVYLQDDFIIRRGETGEEFYMINRGKCELIREKDSIEYETRLDQHGLQNVKEENSKFMHPSYFEDSFISRAQDGGYGNDSMRFGNESEPNGIAKNRAHASKEEQSTLPTYPIAVHLGRGQGFGELALIMNYQRTVNVRAVTCIEMCVLDRNAFQRILQRYPNDRIQVLRKIISSVMTSNEANGLPCPMRDIVQRVYSGMENSNFQETIPISRSAMLVAEAISKNHEDKSVIYGITDTFEDTLLAHRNGTKAETSTKQSPQPVSTTKEAKAAAESMPKAPYCVEAKLSMQEQRLCQVEHNQLRMLEMLQKLETLIEGLTKAPTMPIPHPYGDTSPFAKVSIPGTPPVCERPQVSYIHTSNAPDAPRKLSKTHSLKQNVVSLTPDNASNASELRDDPDWQPQTQSIVETNPAKHPEQLSVRRRKSLTEPALGILRDSLRHGGDDKEGNDKSHLKTEISASLLQSEKPDVTQSIDGERRRSELHTRIEAQEIRLLDESNSNDLRRFSGLRRRNSRLFKQETSRRMPFLKRAGSLMNFTSNSHAASTQSPTQYADQLFSRPSIFEKERAEV